MTAPRVIALWLPDWPNEALRREEPKLAADAPIAIIADGTVAAVSAAGRAAGVSRGLRRREAQSRCPSIVLRPADAERDVRGFEPIVAGLETVVPGVAVLRPGFCVIRAAGPAAYFGAERAAAEALVGRVADLGAIAVARIHQRDEHAAAAWTDHAEHMLHFLELARALQHRVVGGQ